MHLRRDALVQQIDVALVRDKLLACSLNQLQQALDTLRISARRRGLAAEHFYQRIVPAAAADRALRTQLIGHPFDDGTVVIIHAAHQPWIDREWNIAMP